MLKTWMALRDGAPRDYVADISVGFLHEDLQEVVVGFSSEW